MYAIPNIYGEDPAIQITGIRGISVDKKILDKIFNILNKENIKIKSITLDNGVILARFNNVDIQLHASESLVSNLGNKFIVALNLAPSIPNWLNALGGKPMKLGLDLRGGIYFLIEVDIETILSKLQEQNINNLRSNLREKFIPYLTIHKINNYGIEVRFNNKNLCMEAKSYLTPIYHDLVFTILNKNILIVIIKDKVISKIRNYAVLQNINIINNRINQLGVTEPLVQRQGNNHIIIELPGIQDTVRAKEILGATSTLEFSLVNINRNNTFVKYGYIPNDSEIKYTRDNKPVILYKDVILTGDHITNAIFNLDEIGNPQVSISLDNIGGSIMSNFTRDNQGKLIATLFVEYKDSGQKDINGHAILVKDEKVINIAKISNHFSNKFRITGINNITEARQLSLLLRSGSLIAPIKIVEERTIGPTLGLQNIKQGIKASLAGFLVSILFMIIYYRKFGLIASFALLINLIFIVGIMSLLPGVTLTMPGIAGIVLIFAIAIDANVLINERIKEELNNGRSIQRSINEGYKRAFSSILDSNLITLITTIILYMIGTGSIKGFAVTTGIGIITSMFTAIIGTRAIVNLLYGGKYINKISI
ncbi:MAG: protein translocase subunit SecD [Arsenophonus endosymbiont of Ceratovacuna japonica]